MRNPWDTSSDPWDAGDPWTQGPVDSTDESRAAGGPWVSDYDADIASVPASASPDAEMYSFEKVQQIAVHGQGEVWKVQRKGSTGTFAQKFLLPSSIGEVSLKRFHREVRTQSALNHAGIMPVFAVDFDASPPWFVMPLADRSLRDTLKAEVLSEDDTVAMILQVAAALGHAHQEGVVHRDVKPENILLLDGRWVVSDFGLCRDYTAESTTVTRTGTALGTLPYMAPEQWTDPHEVTAAADIFALGRVLYECLTSHLPWPSLKPDLVPDRFKYIVNKCMEDDHTKRYASLDALVLDLKALSAPEDLALPVDHAQNLADRVAANKSGAIAELLQFILKNLSDEVFLRNFLPSVTPPVLALLRAEDITGFQQIIRAFDRVASGSQAFSWTDSAAWFLERVFSISTDAEIRELVLKRILVLGTEHNRWAVRDVYVGIISHLTLPEDVLMVARQLSEYPTGAAFVRPATEHVSLPMRIQQALAA